MTATQRRVSFKLGDGEFSRDVTGETTYGEEFVLLDRDDNLLTRAEWEKSGFILAPLFDSMDDYVALQARIRELVQGVLRDVGVETPTDFRIEDYHKLVDEAAHGAVAKRIQSGFPLSVFPFPEDRIEKRVSALLGTSVKCRYKKNDDTRKFNLRIVRPRSNDNNPPHRDVWLDHLRDAVNVYIPVAGSSPESSLPLVPGSHHWKESEIERTQSGAKMGAQEYTVPCVTATKRDVKFVRPNPGPNEFVLFSPYLIHGGAVNFQGDATRASLEARFWRA